MSCRAAFLTVLAWLLLFTGAAFPQQKNHSAPAAAAAQGEAQKRMDPGAGQQVQGSSGTGQAENRSLGGELAEASREAAGEEVEHGELKYSRPVRWFAKITGMRVQSAYWLGIVVNFAIMAGVFYALGRKRVPALLRARTETIRHSLEEARRASQEANRRLADVESRLAKLDVEIAALRSSAEAEAAGEEDRIRASAEEDKNKIVEGAQQEIEAAARAARRELKAYTAELAVALAKSKIHLDKAADTALVRSFTDQLAQTEASGKDGK